MKFKVGDKVRRVSSNGGVMEVNVESTVTHTTTFENDPDSPADVYSEGAVKIEGHTGWYGAKFFEKVPSWEDVEVGDTVEVRWNPNDKLDARITAEVTNVAEIHRVNVTLGGPQVRDRITLETARLELLSLEKTRRLPTKFGSVVRVGDDVWVLGHDSIWKDDHGMSAFPEYFQNKDWLLVRDGI